MTAAGSFLTLEGVRALQTCRATRDRAGLTIAEGARAVIRARDQGFGIVGLVVSRKLLRGASIRHTLDSFGPRVPVLRVPPTQYRALSLLPDPPGVLAVVEQRWRGLPGAAPRKPRLWLAVEDLRSAGNFGSMLRTAEAAGAAGVVCIGDALDPFDPRVVRASMGSVFAIRHVRASWAELLRFRRECAARVVGAAPGAARDYRRADLTGTAVVLVGSERRGLSTAAREVCDQVVRIPMAGATDSLNVSVATGLLLYEAYRQRWPLGGVNLDRGRQ